MKFLLSILFLFICSTANAATTYYVRVSGGTNTQCTGTTNADYSGTGTAQACAYNHPAWALMGKMVGGDTLIIDDNSGTAKYIIGYGMPNVSCSANSPKNCTLNGIPSGTSSAPTKIYGSAYATGCATKPQLWGTQGVNNVLSMYGGSNIDIECLEITDHSTCTYNLASSSSPYCSQNFPDSTQLWAKTGIEGDPVTNLTLKNIDIEGISHNGMLLGELSGISMISHVNIDGSGFTGWDTDLSSIVGHAANTNFGTLNIDHLNVRYSGCVQAYPHSASFSHSDYSNCTDQNGGGQGDGIGWYGIAGTINWIYGIISWNAQDAIDGIHTNGNDSYSFDKLLIEGNTGNQLKITAKNLNLTNSVIIANCTYLRTASKVYNTSTYNDCRADGGPLSTSTGAAGGTWRFEHNTIYTATGSGGSPALEIVNGNGLCNGTETYIWKNNILVSNQSATNWTPWYSGLSGACATPFASPTNDHNTVYHFNNNPAGSGNVFTSPIFAGSITESSNSNFSNVYLQFSSPSKGTATTGTYWNTSTDINNFTLNAPPDMGAIQYGSTVQNVGPGQTCTATTDCAAGTCISGVCSGSCTARGNACSGNTCCGTDTCTGGVCSIAPTCGDGVIQASESCDGSNLGNQTCVTQGHTGGSLSCASDCHSFVTSSCTDTTLFPLTPVLDSFTRANSTGLGGSWQLLTGRMDISSNAAKSTTVSGFDAYVWPTAFLADQQVYVTVSNKGSDHDSIELHIRYNPTTQTSYYVVYNGNTNVELKRSSSIDHTSEVTIGASITQSISTGDSLGLSVEGSTFTIWYKASAGSWTSLGTRTDTTYTAAGNIVFSSYGVGGSTPDIKFTNLGGGSLNPITCGNGLKEGTEACDGADLAGQSCLTQGFASGTLTCATNCQSFVTISCVTASSCGNNTQETGEICDGTDLVSQTCTGLGYASGSLSCNSSCLSYNTSSCVTSSSGITGGVTVK